MADTKISALTGATIPLAGTEVLPIVQGGMTKQVSIANLTAGRAVSTASLTMSTGSLVPSTAGQGVNFTANTPAAGMTSQLLNWYEEGTCTVTMTALTSGTITLTGGYNTLKYTRVGRQVTLTGLLNVASVSSPVGPLVVNGMPFTSGAGASNQSAISVMGTGLAATAITQLTGFTNTSSTVITLYKYAAGQVSNLAGDVIAGTSFYLTVIYFI